MLSLSAIFIFDLKPDDRPAIFPQLSFQLCGDLAVQFGDLLQIPRIIAALFEITMLDEVWESPIATFSMRPWPAAHEDAQPQFPAE